MLFRSELARWVAGRIREELISDGARNWSRMEVSVSETKGQSATYTDTAPVGRAG